MSDQSNYIGVPFVVDADDIAEESYDYLQTQIENWEPSEGNLERIVTDANSRTGADIMSLLSQITTNIFRYFGKIVDLLPVDATAATALTTWTLIDALGHTIPGGTTVSIRDMNGNPVFFTTINDVVVPAGSAGTDPGGVTIQAVDAGLAGSGLGTFGGVVTLEDPLDFVEFPDGITQVDITLGGQDAETDDSYLSRLTDYLSLLSKGLVIGRDYEAATRAFMPGVRVTAFNGYDPDAGTEGNERVVSESVIDSVGNPISAPQKAALDAYLQSFREANFVIKIFDPTYTQIDVTYDAQLDPGFPTGDMMAAIDATISNFLDPSDWGLPDDRSPGNPAGRSNWVNTTTVSYFELVTAISNTIGVDRLYDLQIAKHGDALGRVDLNMTGKVTLPRPGTIGGTVHTA